MTEQRDRVVVAVVSEDEIDVAALAVAVGSPATGAVVTFEGTVRDHDTPGRGRVERLEYEAHPSAGEVLRTVCREIAELHPGCTVATAHRTGSLGVGDVALVVAVAAAHRREAFTAAADLVDLVKARLPVWKHQVFADGRDEWVGLGEAVPLPA